MMRAVNVLPTAPTVNIMPAVNAVGIGNVLLTVNVMPTVNAASGLERE